MQSPALRAYAVGAAHRPIRPNCGGRPSHVVSVTGESFVIRENRSRERDSADVIKHEMRRLLLEIAAPAEVGDTIKIQRNRAASRVGAVVSASKVKKLWYAEPCTVEAREADHIRQIAAAQKLKKRVAERHFARIRQLSKPAALTNKPLPILELCQGRPRLLVEDT